MLSVVIELRPEERITLPSYTGRMAHAWFLGWVRQTDPERAHRLHAIHQVKPFTVSGLTGGTRHGSTCEFRPGDICWLRITALEDEFAGWLAERLADTLPPLVTLQQCTFQVGRVLTHPDAHTWAGEASYRELVQHYLDSPGVPSTIRLFFASPTTFRVRGRNVPLPLPDLVFGSLADRWHAFAPIALDDAIRAVIAEQVVVSRYELRTQAVPIRHGYQIGFTGRCEFTVLAKNPYWRRVCHLLAAFAFYSGVGYKTPQGLGQTRRYG